MVRKLEIDGACHCGQSTYTAFVNPESVSICHCTDCQTLTGSAFRVPVTAHRDDVSLTGTEPRIYLKTGESGGIRRQHFCGQCGSPVLITNEKDPYVGRRWCGIRQRDQLTPKAAI